MSIQPDYISIGELFGRNYIFRVPRYQRGYAWEDAETDDFLRDITVCYNARLENTQREHFFGGIVAVKHSVTGSAAHHCDLIDGQQRVATFVLLASCLATQFDQICLAATDAGDETSAASAHDLAESIRSTFLEFKDVINRKAVTVQRLELSKPDQPFFAHLTHLNSLPSRPAHFDRESHDRLWRAYQKLHSDLEQTVGECECFEGQIESLAVVRDILLWDATVINIVTDAMPEAYRLFQVLNNRGTQLTEGDLLRASTLEILGAQSLQNEHEVAAGMWDDILRHEPAYTRDFLAWYFASTQGRRAGQSSLFDEFIECLFPQAERSPISKKAAREVVREIEAIQEGNNLCHRLLEGGWPYHDGRSNRWEIDRLQLVTSSLNHTACMPLLLAAADLDERKFIEVLSLVERFSFRYKSVCNLHIGPLQKVYHEHALQIREAPSGYRASSLRAAFRSLQNERATDALFSASLAESLTYQPASGNRLLKYFLSTLEHYWRWYTDGARGNLKCRDRTRVFDLTAMTVEHVYPQKPKRETRQPALDLLVNRLGNLTLLGQDDNDAVGNMAFNEKRTRLARSSIALNRAIADAEAWNSKQIREREKLLIAAALAVFSM